MYECHITIEPVFGDKLEEAKVLGLQWGFRPAKLLLQRRKEDTEERSKNDTFLTSHDERYDNLRDRMIGMCRSLNAADYKVWRYKIEYIMLDSRNDPDELKLLSA